MCLGFIKIIGSSSSMVVSNSFFVSWGLDGMMIFRLVTWVKSDLGDWL